MDSINHPDRTFEGGAFDKGLPRGKASGRLRVTPAAVEFETESARLNLPLDGIKVELGGANDRLVFFKHPAHPDRAFHTRDHEILKHRAFAQNQALTKQVGEVSRKKFITTSIAVTVLVIIIAIPVLLFAFRKPIVDSAATRIPVEWEVKLGEMVYKQIESEGKLVENAALQKELEQITKPLLEGIKDSRYQLKFHIVEDRTLNAFAVPGGHVFLHTGLLLTAESPEEIAGVLAHEIAHVTKRHSIRNILTSAGLFVVVQFLMGDVSGLFAVIANNAHFLISQKFSRDFEREADSEGWEYLITANINPRGMIGFFGKLEAERKRLEEKSPVGSLEGALSFISTHPTTQERIDTLEKKWEATAKKDGYRQFDLNFKAFQDSLRSALHKQKD